MKIAIVTPGKFHSIDLAAELDRCEFLDYLYTGYPAARLSTRELRREKIRTVGMLHTLHAAAAKLRGGSFYHTLLDHLYEIARDDMSRRVAHVVPAVDALIAMSGSGLNCGQAVQERGGKFLCDRASTHILHQQQVLAEEARHLGISVPPIHPRAIERELREYAVADCILVPSDFVLKTFTDRGVPTQKLRVVPYGVDLTAFSRTTEKSAQPSFLFAGSLSMRKGLHYLLSAWRAWGNPEAELRLAGAPAAEFKQLLRTIGGLPERVKILGHLSRHQLAAEMSSAHALVLPSLEEGLALVMLQAMAAGTPVIATYPTGASNLYDHMYHGLIGPPRSVDYLINSFDLVMTNSGLLTVMQARSFVKATDFAGSASYGARIIDVLRDLIGEKTV